MVKYISVLCKFLLVQFGKPDVIRHSIEEFDCQEKYLKNHQEIRVTVFVRIFQTELDTGHL